MEKNLISLILIITLITLSKSDENLCDTLIKESSSEGDLISKIESNIKNLKKNSSLCIKSLLKTSHYKSLENYVKLLNKNGVKFRENLSNSINEIQNELEQIMKENRFQEENYKIISPAFQWAQSLSHIYIDVKFSFRLDSPGCLEINNLNIEINDNKINLIGTCTLDDSPIKFELNLDCLHSFDKDKSEFKIPTQGRYHLFLKKKENKYWERLLSDEKLNISNMKIWYEMKNKYSHELKEFEKNNDDDDEKSFEDIEKEYLERKKKKKNKKKKKKNKDEKADL